MNRARSTAVGGCPSARRHPGWNRLTGDQHVGIRLVGGCAFLVALVVGALVVSAPAGSASAASGSRRAPASYVVAETPAVLPEGIGLRGRGEFYVTSSGTGAIYHGNLRQPRMRLFAAAGSAGRTSALGVHVDAGGRVFVAGSIALDVYSRTGQLLAHRPAPPGDQGPASLNDLVITANAIYVTDFANPRLLRASLTRGRIGPLRPWLDVTTFQPSLPAPYWFLNGIVAADHGRVLLVSSQGLGRVLRVTAPDGQITAVDLDTTTFAADGLELHGRLLYAVLNYQPPAGQGVYVAVLDRDLRRGHVIAAATDRDFALDSPTTLTVADGRVLVVNSQLDHPPGQPPYTVTAIPLRDLAR